MNKNLVPNIKYFAACFACLFLLLKGSDPLLAQDKTVDLTRYTPEWIKDGFANGGATHEPWMFQVRRNKNFNQWQKEYYDYQTSAEYIKSLAEAGVTVYHLYFYKGFGFEAEKVHMDKAAKAAEIAHKYGMKVDTYIQWNTMLYETFFAEVPEAKTDLWYQVDVNGKPIMLTYSHQQSFRYRPCFNHDAYMEYFKEKIIRYAIEVVKTDFLHFDNFDYNDANDADFNPATIAAFRKYLEDKYTPSKRIERFGFDNVSYVLPPMWNNSNPAGTLVEIKDPMMQEWIDFRCWTLVTRLKECIEFARSLNKEVVIEVNSGGIEGGNRAWEYGINHGDLMQYTNVIWAEDLNYAQWQDGVAVGKFRNYKLGRSTTNFIMSYNKTSYDFAENLALNRTIGSLGWSELDEVELKYLSFWRANKELYTGMEGAEKVALLRSYPSMAYNTRDTHISVNMAEQALQQSQIPFDIIYDEHLERLNNYSVLVLANQESLSDENIIAIKAFAKDGGGLVVTDKTGKYDGWRRLRKNNLTDEMYLETGVTGEVKDSFSFVYGMGLVQYIPELIRPEGEIKLGYYTTWVMPENADELVSAVYDVAAEELPLRVLAPEWVGISHDMRGDRDIIHLFNYNHKRDVSGVTLHFKGAVKRASAISPDREGEINIPFTGNDKGVTLKIPDFPVYMIITLVRE
jgi:hypothetical protein